MTDSACASASVDRSIDLAEAFNARDLGGLPTVDGRRTDSGRIIRSDLPERSHEADRRVLMEGIGLRRVVDLRTPAEIEMHPGPWGDFDVEVVCAPFPVDPKAVAGEIEEMAAIYLSFLEPPAPAMTHALAALLDVEQHPVLVHCAAGKDRTGVIVALALDLLGVDRAAILADYSLSAARMPEILERVVRTTGQEEMRTLPSVMYMADAATIEAVLATVDERYGGSERWAIDRGIDPAAIERFRATMLVG